MANSMWGKSLKLKLSTINILRTTTLLQLKSEHLHIVTEMFFVTVAKLM
jgi:hypothetical protein